MIAQWENQCISLSVLSMARVMIAQWENECISLSALPVARDHDSSVGEWKYLTVCPLYGPGHDSSVREWMYLTVCPPCGPGYDSSVGEWMYLTVCPLYGPGSIPMVEYFKRFLLGWSPSASPSWASVAENDSIFPQWHHTTSGHRGGRSKSNHRQTMAETKWL